tara:strand:- start:14339 stop:15016 length:678 start_codon:yes stop_codon:yes gene_type:complete
MKRKILIDTGYFVFTTIYSIINNKNDITNENLSRMLEKFKHKASIKLYQILSRHKTEANNVYFIRDCPRTSIWRKKINKEYKNCNNSSYVNIMGAFFSIMYTDIIHEFRAIHKCHVVKVDGAEADDIISLFIKFQEGPFTIISKDKDLFQLIKNNKNIDFYTVGGKCINYRADKWVGLIKFDKKQLYSTMYNKEFINLDVIPYKIYTKFINLIHNINITNTIKSI